MGTSAPPHGMAGRVKKHCPSPPGPCSHPLTWPSPALVSGHQARLLPLQSGRLALSPRPGGIDPAVPIHLPSLTWSPTQVTKELNSSPSRRRTPYPHLSHPQDQTARVTTAFSQLREPSGLALAATPPPASSIPYSLNRSSLGTPSGATEDFKQNPPFPVSPWHLELPRQGSSSTGQPSSAPSSKKRRLPLKP